MTAVSATKGTYITVYPGPLSQSPPGASDLNVAAGVTSTNLVVVGVGSDGTINLFNAVGTVNLIVDVLGYYSSGSTAPLGSPVYSSTLVGPGQADMYPVDVSNDAQYYFVLDAGNYRIIAVNRSTDAIDCQIGGLQGNGPGQIGDARALDYDSSNNELFVADTPNNRIEVFSFSASACATDSASAFTFLSQFGTRGSGDEQFSQVYGVAVDAAHSWVYAVDGAGRVEKSDLAGNLISQFNAGGSLNEPRQVTVAPNSDVLVMDARNHQCDVFNDSGTLLFSFGSLGTGPGQFTDDPRGVAVSADGTLAFVTDSGGKRVEVFNLQASGGDYTGATFAYTIPSAASGAGQFVGPRGLTTTSDDHLLLTDEWGFNLHEMTFTATAAMSTVNTTPAAAPVPGVNAPRGVHVAAGGQIYIVDYWNQRVEYMNADGTGAGSFGFRGNPSQSGAINFAWDAAIQPGTGDVFVANRENDQVAVFSPTGASLLIFGKNGAANGQFSFPQGIAFARTARCSSTTRATTGSSGSACPPGTPARPGRRRTGRPASGRRHRRAISTIRRASPWPLTAPSGSPTRSTTAFRACRRAVSGLPSPSRSAPGCSLRTASRGASRSPRTAASGSPTPATTGWCRSTRPAT